MRTLEQSWFEINRPVDRRRTSEWAQDRNVWLTPPLSKEGWLDLTESRHFVEPLDAMWDDGVRQVNLLAPPRSGKTLIVEVHVHSVIVRQPGGILWSFQEEQAARDEAELRLWPQFEASPHIRKLLPKGNAARTKEINFRRSPMQITGPADSNFQSRGWQNVILDEVWMYKRGKVAEARGRLGDFEKLGTDKFILLSQGGETDSDWDVEVQRGLLHEWFFKCEKCDHLMFPRLRGFRADGSRWGLVFDNIKNDRGLLVESRVVPTVRFVCEKCGHAHVWSNRLKRELNRTGRYVVESAAEKRDFRKTFRWNALVDTQWDVVCAGYVAALNALKLGNPVPLIKFLQKSGAEMASERTVLEGGQVFARVEIQSGAWEFADERLMAVDKQEDYFWAEVRDFSRRLNGESRRVWFGKPFSYEEIERKREELGVSPERVFIDSGYKAKGPDGVYAACVRYGWTAVKGVGTVSGERSQAFWHTVRVGEMSVRVQKSYAALAGGDPESGTRGEGLNLARLIRFSADDLADRLDGLIENDLYKEPVVDESDALEIERRKHFAAEFKKKKVDKFSGKETWVRVCPSGNNHSYDLGKMLVLGAVLTDVIPDTYEEAPRAAA